MKKPLPPAYFLGAIILSIALHFLLPLRQLLFFPWRLVGLVPMFIGIVLNLLADQAFKKHSTTVKPFEESNALITAGVLVDSITATHAVALKSLLHQSLPHHVLRRNPTAFSCNPT